MKKIIAVIVVLGGALILGTVVFLMPDPETHVTQSVPAGNGVVKIKDLHHSNLRIVPGRTSKITMDLKGPENELRKVRFFRVGSDTEIEVSEDWKNVSGTITVPEGTWVNLDETNGDEPDSQKPSDPIRVGGGSSITIDDEEVMVTGSGGSTPPSPAPTDENDAGGATDDGGGEPDTASDPAPPPLPPADGEGEGEGEEESEGGYEGGDEEGPNEPDSFEYTPDEPEESYTHCTIRLKQEDRNDCCQAVFADEPHPDCAYTGYWLFNYHSRLCYYHCFHPCNQGTQEQRDQCCADEHHYDTTPPCIGNWVYDNTVNGCSYECLNEEELEDYFDAEEEQFTDFVSQACSTHSNPDQCCDYNLKNELSIGPRPGFPDCIGQWHFNESSSTCEFQCADYGEMIDILNQLEE